MITGILYSHARPRVAATVLAHIKAAAEFANADIVGVFDWPAPELGPFVRVHKPQAENPHLDIYERIIAGCEAATTPEVALLEHDVLYPQKYLAIAAAAARSHMLAYSALCASLNKQGYFWRRPPLSTCIGDRTYIADLCRDKIEQIRAGKKITWAELGGDTMQLTIPKYQNHVIIDLRLGGNLTGPRTAHKYMDKLTGWPDAADLLKQLEVGNAS